MLVVFLIADYWVAKAAIESDAGWLVLKLNTLRIAINTFLGPAMRYFFLWAWSTSPKARVGSRWPGL